MLIPRYIDRIPTTPLIVLFLWLLAGIERFALFGIGPVAFVGLLCYLYGPMARRVRGKTDRIERRTASRNCTCDSGT